MFAEVHGSVDLRSGIRCPPGNLRHTARLPERIGTRLCGVHEGELAALLSCVPRAPDAPSQTIVDRDALISLVDALPGRSRRDVIRGNLPPWETRLALALQRREEQLSELEPLPKVPAPEGYDSWRTSGVYERTRLTWVPSHQPEGDNSLAPNAFCVSLNH